MKLNFTGYFITPIYSIEIPEWIEPLIKATDPFIKEAKYNHKKKCKTSSSISSFQDFKSFCFVFQSLSYFSPGGYLSSLIPNLSLV